MILSPRMMTAIAAIGFMAGSNPAAAADYAATETSYGWTGFYGGVVAGVAGGSFENNIPTNPGPTDEGGGFTAGAHVGYNHQLDHSWVVGVEADFSIVNIDADSTNGSFEERWLGTLRGRAGYAFDSYLAYVTAGVAFTHVDAVRTGIGSDQGWVAGLTGGVGIEGYMTENWTARVEYLFVDVPETSFDAGAVTIRGGSDNHVGRIGLSYHF